MSQAADTTPAAALRARGYPLLPVPRKITLGPGTVRLDAGWRLDVTGIPADDIAVALLVAEVLGKGYGVTLKAGADGGKRLRLAIQPGAVETGTGDGRDAQAYRLAISAESVEVVGNAPAGLFYGVQTLAQLMARDNAEGVVLPETAIVDWPEYELRFVHWDTKHHQDRVETLKKFLFWTAHFKLNAVSFELEDKFEYPSHPAIGAPGAFTTAELQELVDFALARHIQIVPNVQAPAHMGYVLKHAEFAHLKCDGSNYQICMDDPEARRLIFDMYDDLCRATQGVKYFHVSTDEVYYAGICERYRKPYTPENRSLTWVDFVRAAHEHLARQGRRILIWAEFPLLAEHVALLPPDIIDGILSPEKDAAMVRAEDARGIRQLAYVPIQGEEKLFPNYFPCTERDGRPQPGRLADVYRITLHPSPHGGRPIGTFVAAWDDAGLHNETFWLGWASMAQGGWTPGAASVDEIVASFMEIYYGRAAAADMTEAYRLLQSQARFWEYAWDLVPSTVRPPGYGWSERKCPARRQDMTLAAPARPTMPDLALTPAFRSRYERLLTEVPERRRENERLILLLSRAVLGAEQNRYGTQVLVSLALFIAPFLDVLAGLGEAEESLLHASQAHRSGRPGQALDHLAAALRRVKRTDEAMAAAYAAFVATWEESRLPHNVPVGGRTFLHVMDDVKDHFADRRPDLSYHLAPYESIGLDKWCDALAGIIRAYAEAHGLTPPIP